MGISLAQMFSKTNNFILDSYFIFIHSLSFRSFFNYYVRQSIHKEKSWSLNLLTLIYMKIKMDHPFRIWELIDFLFLNLLDDA